ncbi:MAG TPA: biotin/lipoyl-containing protein [Candidatus Limnocylindrales bacterium]
MPEPRPTGDRTPAQRRADHASLAQLSESLVPALVQKLSSSGLGELEVREGDWRIRLRRSNPAAASAPRRADRPRLGSHADREGRGRETTPTASGASQAQAGAAPAVPRRTMVTSPAVGVFRPDVKPGARVRSGDRIASVDLLGIGQDVISPIDGTLVEVLAGAGDVVEYGEEVAAVESDVTVETDDAPAADDAPGAGGEASA